MTLKDIKQAVNLTLKEAYPGTKIYGPDTIEGYTRPSFLFMSHRRFQKEQKMRFTKTLRSKLTLSRNGLMNLRQWNSLKKWKPLLAINLRLAAGN